MELLKRTKVEEELKIAKREGLLNIQSLTIRLSLHSSSTSKCVKGKAYNKKIQFAQMIIRDINRTRTSVIEFLRKSKRYWRPKEQTRPRATSIDSVFIEESKDDEAMEQHFVATQTMERTQGRRTLLRWKNNYPWKYMWKYNKPQRCRGWQKHNKGRWRWRGMKRKL